MHPLTALDELLPAADVLILTVPLTGMFVFNMMEYELFPAWDSSTRAFLLLLGIFTGIYHEYFPAQKAPAEAEA